MAIVSRILATYAAGAPLLVTASPCIGVWFDATFLESTDPIVPPDACAGPRERLPNTGRDR
jgi:hypothetical protein